MDPENQKRKIYTNKAYSFEEAEQFDREFWKNVGPEGVFSAAWVMLEDSFKMKGKCYDEYADQLRLRRSVQNIEYLPD